MSSAERLLFDRAIVQERQHEPRPRPFSFWVTLNAQAAANSRLRLAAVARRQFQGANLDRGRQLVYFEQEQKRSIQAMWSSILRYELTCFDYDVHMTKRRRP